MQSFSAFSKFLSKLSANSRILILSHKACDIDSFASSASLFLALKKNRKKFKLEIGVPDHINRSALALSQNLKIPFTLNPGLSSFGAVIAVDFTVFELAGSLALQLKSFQKPVLVLDHHEESKSKLITTRFKIIDKQAVSTTELIFQLFKKQKIKITSKIACLIAVGIIMDSAHFAIASALTFQAMQECLQKSKKSFQDLLLLFAVKHDSSERIAQLKSLKRASVFKAGDFLLASSNVGSFEASAADSIIKCGADVAFVGALNHDNAKVSGRASARFLKQTQASLARNVFEKLSEQFQGSGGGHAGAAAFNGKTSDLHKILDACIFLAFQKIKEKNPKAVLKQIA